MPKNDLTIELAGIEEGALPGRYRKCEGCGHTTGIHSNDLTWCLALQCRCGGYDAPLAKRPQAHRPAARVYHARRVP